MEYSRSLCVPASCKGHGVPRAGVQCRARVACRLHCRNEFHQCIAHKPIAHKPIGWMQVVRCTPYTYMYLAWGDAAISEVSRS